MNSTQVVEQVNQDLHMKMPASVAAGAPILHHRLSSGGVCVLHARAGLNPRAQRTKPLRGSLLALQGPGRPSPTHDACPGGRRERKRPAAAGVGESHECIAGKPLFFAKRHLHPHTRRGLRHEARAIGQEGGVKVRSKRHLHLHTFTMDGWSRGGA